MVLSVSDYGEGRPLLSRDRRTWQARGDVLSLSCLSSSVSRSQADGKGALRLINTNASELDRKCGHTLPAARPSQTTPWCRFNLDLHLARRMLTETRGDIRCDIIPWHKANS